MLVMSFFVLLLIFRNVGYFIASVSQSCELHKCSKANITSLFIISLKLTLL